MDYFGKNACYALEGVEGHETWSCHVSIRKSPISPRWEGPRRQLVSIWIAKISDKGSVRPLSGRAFNRRATVPCAGFVPSSNMILS